MRVLHVMSTIDPKSGGPSNAIRGLASAQARTGLDVTVVSTYRATDDYTQAAEAMRGAGATVEMIGPATGRFLTHPQMTSVLSRLVQQADIVHIHALWEEVQHRSAVISRRLRKPYIFRPCGMLDPWSLSQSKWVKRLYMLMRLRRDLNGAVAIHYTADEERDRAAPLKLKANPVVVANGIDLDEFEARPPAGTFREAHPSIGDRPIVLFLSRVHPKKGLDILINALAQLMPRWGAGDAGRPVLVVAGPAHENHADEMAHLARSRGMQVASTPAEATSATDVMFTGPLHGPDKLSAYTDATVFVLPSHQENFGIVVVEALACGCPVVISDQVNIHQEISQNGMGSVEPLDVERFAAAITPWLTAPPARGDFARRAWKFVNDRYSWTAIAREWAERYPRLLGRG